MDNIKGFWKGLTKRGKIVVGALAIIVCIILYGIIF